MTYDIKCYRLAVDFLDDHSAINTAENADKLAQEIQRAIEDWIQDAELSISER